MPSARPTFFDERMSFCTRLRHRFDAHGVVPETQIVRTIHTVWGGCRVCQPIRGKAVCDREEAPPLRVEMEKVFH